MVQQGGGRARSDHIRVDVELDDKEMRYYTVIEEREVKVAAKTPIDAALVAAAAFYYGQDPQGNAKNIPPDVTGRTTTTIRVRDIVAREEY